MTQTTNTMYDVIVAAADRDGLVVLEPEEDTREEIEGFVSDAANRARSVIANGAIPEIFYQRDLERAGRV
jgi:hypothetical protein